jgi:large subunit ribosomal protein L2
MRTTAQKQKDQKCRWGVGEQNWNPTQKKKMKQEKQIKIKKLRKPCKQTSGRNNQGRITVWHRGGGNKKLYRILDFRRTISNVPARIVQIQKDPNRTSLIALVNYRNGLVSYILAPKNVKQGDIIETGEQVEIAVGNALPIGNIPTGTMIHNIELKPGQGGRMTRAAGTYAKIIKKDPKTGTILIRLKSGKLFNISPYAMATIGMVSGESTKITKLYKAGQARWRNRRPVVRGMAMNPIDHPHGGGQGRSKGGAHPVTPWGKLTKGKLTRSKKKRSLISVGIKNLVGKGSNNV